MEGGAGVGPPLDAPPAPPPAVAACDGLKQPTKMMVFPRRTQRPICCGRLKPPARDWRPPGSDWRPPADRPGRRRPLPRIRPDRPGAKRPAAPRKAPAAAALGFRPPDRDALRAASPPKRTNSRARLNSWSSGLSPSNSKPNNRPACDASEPPICAPIGPPKKPPATRPSIGNPFLATFLNPLPSQRPVGDWANFLKPRAALPTSLPMNWSNSASFETVSSSAANSSASASSKGLS